MSASRNALALTCCLAAAGCQIAPKSNPNPAVSNLPAAHGAPPRPNHTKPAPDAPATGDTSEHHPSDDGPIPSDWKNFPDDYPNKGVVATRPANPAAASAATAPATAAVVPPVRSAADWGLAKPTPRHDAPMTQPSPAPPAPPEPAKAAVPPTPQPTPVRTATIAPTPPASPTQAHALPQSGQSPIPPAAVKPAAQPAPVAAAPLTPAPPSTAGLTVPETVALPSDKLPVKDDKGQPRSLDVQSPQPNIRDNPLNPTLPVAASVGGVTPGVGAGMTHSPGVPVAIGPALSPSMSPPGLRPAVPLPGGWANGPAAGPQGPRAGPQLALNSPILAPGIDLDRSSHLHVPLPENLGAAHAPTPAPSFIPLSDPMDSGIHPKPRPIDFTSLFAASSVGAAPTVSLPGAAEGTGAWGAGGHSPSAGPLLAINLNSLSTSALDKPPESEAGLVLPFSAGFLGSPAGKNPASKLPVPAAGDLLPQPPAPRTVHLFSSLAPAAAPAPSPPKPQSRADTLMALRNMTVAHVALWSAVAPRGQVMTRADAISNVEAANGSSQFIAVPLPGNKSSQWQTVIDQTNDALGLVDWLGDAAREEADRREQLARYAAQQQAARARREKLDHSVYDYLLGPATQPAEKAGAK